MVDFYTDISSLTTAVCTAVSSCVRDYPAKGWIRGEITDDKKEIEAMIEKYMQEHVASDEDVKNALLELDSKSVWGSF